MKILILAAGPDDGWNEPYPKQLCPIAGEPLLTWTLRDFGSGTVITNKPEILEMDVDCFVPECTDTIFDTILSTRKLWEDRVLVLVGDAFYNDDMRAEILEWEGGTPVMFCSHSLMFDEKDYGGMEAKLRRRADVPGEDFFNRLYLYEEMHHTCEARGGLDFDILPYYQKFLDENPWAR